MAAGLATTGIDFVIESSDDRLTVCDVAACMPSPRGIRLAPGPGVDPTIELRADMGTANAAQAARAYFTHNVALTGRIYEATGNETLQRLLSSIEKQARRYRFMAYATRPELIAQSEKGNRRIVDAIAGGKPQTARDITEGLIRTSWKAIDAHLRSAGFDE